MQKDVEQQRVAYWLQSIQSRASKAPILLIATHADETDVDADSAYGTDMLKVIMCCILLYCTVL